MKETRGSESYAGIGSRTELHLSLLFGLIYFVQGLAEPGEGLIAQPVRSLLRGWQLSPGEISHFMAMVSAPWVIKPLYGLIIDFIPLWGSRRRNYLLAAAAAASMSLILMAFSVPRHGETARLMVLLLIPTLSVAFADVVADALMVEKGQPLGLTGRLQSMQWAAMYAATLMAGSLGGWLSQTSRQDLGFLICGIGAGVSFVATYFWIFETQEKMLPGANLPLEECSPDSSERIDTVIKETAGDRLRIMGRTLLSGPFLLTTAFLFLWNFNPFSSTIQYVHMTEELKLSEQQYGHTLSLFSGGAMAACLVYGLVCRMIPDRWLIHIAIAAGVSATLAYLLAEGIRSALLVSVFAGFVYMLGNLIQLDIAARMCPPVIAGSLFAMLMSVSNTAIILSTSVGGWFYDLLENGRGASQSYTILVFTGAATTAMCWILSPWMTTSRAASDKS